MALSFGMSDKLGFIEHGSIFMPLAEKAEESKWYVVKPSLAHLNIKILLDATVEQPKRSGQYQCH
jgi:hypothetical protein